MARHIKYNEKLQTLSIALEPSMIEYLRETANENNISLNEQITSLLLTSDKLLANSLIKKFNAIKKGVDKLNSSVGSVSEMVFKPLESFEDSDLTDVLESYHGHPQTADLNDAISYLFGKYQDKKLLKNERIVNAALVKLIIRKKLLEKVENEKKVQA